LPFPFSTLPFPVSRFPCFIRFSVLFQNSVHGRWLWNLGRRDREQVAPHPALDFFWTALEWTARLLGPAALPATGRPLAKSDNEFFFFLFSFFFRVSLLSFSIVRFAFPCSDGGLSGVAWDRLWTLCHKSLSAISLVLFSSSSTSSHFPSSSPSRCS
jgi:hypothetical protein